MARGSLSESGEGCVRVSWGRALAAASSSCPELSLTHSALGSQVLACSPSRIQSDVAADTLVAAAGRTETPLPAPPQVLPPTWACSLPAPQRTRKTKWVFKRHSPHFTGPVPDFSKFWVCVKGGGTLGYQEPGSILGLPFVVPKG